MTYVSKVKMNSNDKNPYLYSHLPFALVLQRNVDAAQIFVMAPKLP